VSHRRQASELPEDAEYTCPAGIYLHTPFCRQKCRYCDFVSVTDVNLLDDYVDALCGEIELRQQHQIGVDSIYLGGGTPTLLATDQVNQTLTAVRSAFQIHPDVEITIEVNPGTVTLEALKAYVAMGINRISIGVQSFQPQLLDLLGRSHDEKTATDALELSGAAGFSQIGIDLIFGIPGQTSDQFIDDLQTAIKFSPHHLSCYSLTIASNTPLQRLCRQQAVTPADDSQVARFFMETDAFLTSHGYQHYEISNFAKPDCRSRHNRKYWRGIPYWGFGVAAHSFQPPVRSWNVSSIGRYIATLDRNRLPILDHETLSLKEQAVETIMLGLRTDHGVELAFLDGLQRGDNGNAKARLIQQWVNEGQARIHKGGLVLTVSGMLVADALTKELLELLM